MALGIVSVYYCSKKLDTPLFFGLKGIYYRGSVTKALALTGYTILFPLALNGDEFLLFVIKAPLSLFKWEDLTEF